MKTGVMARLLRSLISALMFSCLFMLTFLDDVIAGLNQVDLSNS